MFHENVGDGPPAFRGNVLISSDVSKKEVWEALKADVYAKEGIWDLEKVGSVVFNMLQLVMTPCRLKSSLSTACSGLG
jgi:hypothetical protein